MRKALKIIFFLLLWIGSFAVCTWAAGASIFYKQFLPGTIVNGIDVSMQNITKTMNAVELSYPKELIITERDGRTFNISLKDIILNTEATDFAKEQKDLAIYWFLHLNDHTIFETNDYTWKLDEERLSERIELVLNKEKRDRPKDAYLNIETMTVVPEEEGNTLLTDNVIADAVQCITEDKFSLTLNDEYYEHPTVYADEQVFTDIIEQYHSLIDRTINVHIVGDINEQITTEQLKSWITYNGSEFIFNDEAIKEYSDALYDKYTTAYTLRDFPTSYGSIIQVGDGYYDNYVGWIVDDTATYENILNAVHEGAENVELIFEEYGYALDENGDIGGTYIEISIDNQHMFFYKDYQLILDTDIVSGTETDPERRTVRGLFHVLQMSSPYVMHGDYGSQPCDYFIRITWMGHAIHDAPWQASFGGTRYINAGSHGCINTPYSIVSQLWNELQSLDDWQVPIIIY